MRVSYCATTIAPSTWPAIHRSHMNPEALVNLAGTCVFRPSALARGGATDLQALTRHLKMFRFPRCALGHWGNVRDSAIISLLLKALTKAVNWHHPRWPQSQLRGCGPVHGGECPGIAQGLSAEDHSRCTSNHLLRGLDHGLEKAVPIMLHLPPPYNCAF